MCCFLFVSIGSKFKQLSWFKIGLPHCGPAIASAIAAGPLAKSLYHAVKTYSEKELHDFIPSWKRSLQHELTNDPDGRLGRKYSSLADNIPSTFPNPTVLRQYCRPLTSIRVPDHATAWLTPQVPQTTELARLASRLFDWGPHIVDRFISHVWDGYFIRKLIKVWILWLPVTVLHKQQSWQVCSAESGVYFSFDNSRRPTQFYLPNNWQHPQNFE